MTTAEAIERLITYADYMEDLSPITTEANKMAVAALRTLDKQHAYHGGELWKPPLGKPPNLGYWISYETESWKSGPSKGGGGKPRKKYRCSECRKATAVATPYCPQCGAKMSKEERGDSECSQV